MIWALPENLQIFPHPLSADDEGILAFGFKLSPDQILLAYRFGIFPWYSPGDPVLWWYTNPRSVLRPSEVRISKTMRKLMRTTSWTITFDQAFTDVMEACREVERKGQDSTWIQDDILENYTELFKMGYAHSVEVWDNDRLIGGLYGLAIGHVFYGESMFTRESNASKFAFIHLCQYLESRSFDLVDCQQETSHLNSLGAKNICGKAFLDELRENLRYCMAHGDFHFYNNED